MKVMRLLGLLAPFIIAAGGIVYAVTGELGNLSLGLIWVGILLALFFAYTNFSLIGQFLGKRSTKYSANTVVMICIFSVIISLVAVMSVRHKIRVDFTENKRYTLAPQTIKVLKSLQMDVEAIAFYRSDERTRQAMADLLKEYSYYSPKFKFWFVDPDKNPLEAAKYGVTSYRTTLIRYDGKEETVGFESENKVTNALLKVLRKKIKIIYFLTGHGENDLDSPDNVGYQAVKESLIKEHHEVRKLLLAQSKTIPEDASVIVISGPKKDLQARELEMITDYINKGGRAFFLLDPGDAPQMGAYLSGFGFELGNDIIVDKMSQVFGGNYLTPVVSDYDDKHPITWEFDVSTFFPIARSVRIKEDPALGNFNLATTNRSSWARSKGTLNEDNLDFNEGVDEKGPLSVLATTSIEVITEATQSEEVVAEATQNEPLVPVKAELKRWGKIVVAGDSNFVSNTHIQMAGNRDLFLNIVNWLAEENLLISIRKKEAGLTPVTLTATQGRFIFWICVIIMPSLMLVFGIAVTSRRKLAT